MSDKTYEVLRGAIIDGRLQSGERLVEAEVSQRFELRPSAVRKALIRLEQDDIVEREPYRGARVRRLTREHLEEVLEANAALKTVAIRRAARRATAAQVSALWETLSELRAAYDADQFMDAATLTVKLHHELLETAGQEVIRRLSGLLSVHMARLQYQTVLVPGGGERSFRLQKRIVDAVARGDEDAAVEAMIQHFANTSEAVVAHVAGWSVSVAA